MNYLIIPVCTLLMNVFISQAVPQFGNNLYSPSHGIDGFGYGDDAPDQYDSWYNPSYLKKKSKNEDSKTGYNDGYNAGQTLSNTGHSDYQSSFQGTPYKGSVPDTLYKSGQDSSYKDSFLGTSYKDSVPDTLYKKSGQDTPYKDSFLDSGYNDGYGNAGQTLSKTGHSDYQSSFPDTSYKKSGQDTSYQSTYGGGSSGNKDFSSVYGESGSKVPSDFSKQKSGSQSPYESNPKSNSNSFVDEFGNYFYKNSDSDNKQSPDSSAGLGAGQSGHELNIGTTPKTTAQEVITATKEEKNKNEDAKLLGTASSDQKQNQQDPGKLKEPGQQKSASNNGEQTKQQSKEPKKPEDSESHNLTKKHKEHSKNKGQSKGSKDHHSPKKHAETKGHEETKKNAEEHKSSKQSKGQSAASNSEEHLKDSKGKNPKDAKTQKHSATPQTENKPKGHDEHKTPQKTDQNSDHKLKGFAKEWDKLKKAEQHVVKDIKHLFHKKSKKEH